MEKSRLFYILYYLLEKRKTTAEELAVKFEVSTRTIYRDIDSLSQAGIPIYANVGYQGGIYLKDDFILDKALFNEEEMTSLLAILKAVEESEHWNIKSILAKLNGFEHLDEDWLKIDLTRWGDDKNADIDLFQKLKKAILQTQTIIIAYHGVNGHSLRMVDPYYLKYQGGGWYLEGYCHKRAAMRMFRLTRILKIEVQEKTFSRLTYNEVQVDKKDYEYCEFLFSKRVAYRVYDIFARSAIEEVSTGVSVKVNLLIDEWMDSFLLSMGGEVEIIKPERLRQKIVKLHEEAIKKVGA
ncbi:putative DNA-binding transcriptional regulator YafY [Breznakia sp. PF5-3]|uniref:helix-turn-helix transcriptional regulator n=1 Tax=unclassified Breznakia TaxID=2623764 RepID=UPI002404C317|nr:MULTISPECIES: YafY family protein [unclassified Breznakia]MDL2276721.1 YafY family transcriptional regulator [Breznakia sp. OttesenSCG-928-G09]MDF9825820.1 putative DNA-binding transcriptional regulator YafY [Breznakia sp. PM6-1]MDF9836625.1 putative DNA-binding transcriptional regulator YafY [Breznakia sp. PF5-3]MDF9838852.1 putative DNA-binding transcriptional regulator YafY [Breznakia sp. PFB2-8]MDF9860878.1 putative DNA-binding transcriptional regulator YafY [Breznakia sp. PH5-24]